MTWRKSASCPPGIASLLHAAVNNNRGASNLRHVRISKVSRLRRTRFFHLNWGVNLLVELILWVNNEKCYCTSRIQTQSVRECYQKIKFCCTTYRRLQPHKNMPQLSIHSGKPQSRPPELHDSLLQLSTLRCLEPPKELLCYES